MSELFKTQCHQYVDVTDPVKRLELVHAIERGINTWELRPEWLTRLVDELKGQHGQNKH